MTDEKPDYQENKEPSGDLSRRDFVAMSVAAGMVAATGTASAAEAVTETNVQIKTPDGTCDAAYIHPVSGSHPGVVIWADAFGLRPAMRDIGKRIAAEGYSVLVPNPCYRGSKNLDIDAAHVIFSMADYISILRPLIAYVIYHINTEMNSIAYDTLSFALKYLYD